MPVNMHFNYKDVPRAARFGFSAKKMWVQFMGFLIGTIVYDIFAYIGLLLSGLTLSEIWKEYHYLPIPLGESLTFVGEVFIIIGAILFGIILLLSGVAISKITYEQLKGDEFYEVSKAVKFSLREGKAAVTAILTLVIVAIFVLLGGVIVGLLGKIPWFGELVLLLLSVPIFFAGLFLVYLFFSFIFASYLAASIVATTNSDTFDTLFEIFSTVNEQNWRFVAYETLLYGTKIVAFSLFVWAISKGLWIIHNVLASPWLMGPKFANIEQVALSYFPVITPLYNIEPVLRVLGADAILNIPYSLPTLTVPQEILGFIFGIFFYFIVFFALSYWGAMHWSGNTLIFTVLAKKKDDIDLLRTGEERAESYVPEEKPEAEEKEPKSPGEETEG